MDLTGTYTGLRVLREAPVHLLQDSVLKCPPGAFPLFSFPPRLKSVLWLFFFFLTSFFFHKM